MGEKEGSNIKDDKIIFKRVICLFDTFERGLICIQSVSILIVCVGISLEMKKESNA